MSIPYLLSLLLSVCRYEVVGGDGVYGSVQSSSSTLYLIYFTLF